MSSAVPALFPGAIEPLGEAAFFFKGFGLSSELSTQQGCGHTDKDQDRIG
jgi:hypothetical protein